MAARSRDLIEIQNAIDGEIAEYPEAYRFLVGSVRQEGPVWKVFVELQEGRRHGLDEGLEGARAWWPGPPSGHADVLSVIPEDQQINLRFASGQPPASGPIFVYPPKYLDALKAHWESEEAAKTSLQWLARISEYNKFSGDQATQLVARTGLRERQLEALSLTGWDAGFVWGPPGTGKTHTLGVLLAEYLAALPNHRVLLLSTTNTAVDQALVSVDKALERMATQGRRYADLRGQCARVGNHFVASNYAGRRHLLPSKNDELLKRLTKLEGQKPDAIDVRAYADWKRDVEQVRAALRVQTVEVLRQARLAALTTTRALFGLREISALPKYDLLVFDEASQVPIVMAAALACLGVRTLFAGDPQQLAPIVRSNRDDCQKWFGRSMFAYKHFTPKAICLLDEQSRMVAPICRLVSAVFYDGKLRVAADCASDPEWAARRRIRAVASLGSNETHIEAVASSGRWSPLYGGMVREESAEYMARIAGAIAQVEGEPHVLLLTPFRAQRALIRSLLRKANLKVSVSTVHRAQGSERHTVLFDPVAGTNPFLLTEDARRLINVAISRSQARLVLTLSPDDCGNPVLRQIADLVGFDLIARELPTATPIELALTAPGFPELFIGRLVSIDLAVGRLLTVSEGAVVLTDAATGRIKKFKLEVLRKRPIPKGNPLPRPAVKTPEGLVLARAAQEPKPSNTRQLGTPTMPGTPPAVIRAAIQSMVSAPRTPRLLPPSSSAGEGRQPSSPKPPARGRVTSVLEGWGYITCNDGQIYQYAYVDLGSELKLRGIQKGAVVGFTPGPARAGQRSALKVVPWQD